MCAYHCDCSDVSATTFLTCDENTVGRLGWQQHRDYALCFRGKFICYRSRAQTVQESVQVSNCVRRWLPVIPSSRQ